MEDRRSAGTSRGQPTFAVSVCPVRRTNAAEEYDSSNYEVCLLREAGAERCGTLTCVVEPGTHPERVAQRELKAQTQLSVSRFVPLHIQAQPHRGEHTITVFYLAPVNEKDEAHGFPSVETAFENLQFVLENHHNEFDMFYGHRDMILAVDSWLRDQHRLDEVSPHLDLLFNSADDRSEDRVSVPVGHLKFAIDANPLYEESIEPIEDCLLIGFNNPLFLHAELQAST
ncbi:uncharacterized protein LOC135806041 [Sycon ciliatum]|uniref:uncharacterized protein LOC135806041 n=1 Tax=Sycon ciliatum TaxID=27933 RepID=UPI0020AE2BF6|eukprot:scpid82090/ scgid9962/ 